VLNFGGLLYAMITVSNAARTGAQYYMMGTSTLHAPTTPTAVQIATQVDEDLKALPNRTSAQIKVCSNNNGTITCNLCTNSGSISCASSSGTPPAEPEPAPYILGTVDVTYTYKPFVKAWNFGALKVGLIALMGSDISVHRRTAMRLGGGV